MKDESEPVTSDEWLIRRVHEVSFRTEKTSYISPEIEALEMSVIPTAIDEIPGHVSIPELDVAAWNERRPLCKKRMDRLAEIVSQDYRILRDPKHLN